MYIVELKDLDVRLGDGEFSVTTPTTLSSVLCARNAQNQNAITEYKDLIDDLKAEISFGVSFILSHEAANQHFAFIEMPDLGAAVEVSFNGTATFSLSGGRAHRLDISKHTVPGANSLVIRFPESKEPRDVTFFDSVKFIAFSHAHIADIIAKSVFVSDTVSVDVALEFVGDPTDVKAVANLVSPSGKIYYGGVINGHAVINVQDPLLWWPGNYGIHNLYKLSVNLYYGNEVIDSASVKIGLRSVFLDERTGASFTVNGSKVLMMGTETAFDDVISAHILEEKKEKIVSMLEKANMNFLRLSVSGTYPDDEFLSLCDENGIALEIVIKSKKLENGDESAFKREIKYHLKRFSRHPSVISVAYKDGSLAATYERVISDVKSALSSPIIVRKVTDADSFLLSPSLPDLKTVKEVVPSGDFNIFSFDMNGGSPDVTDQLEMLSLGAKEYKYAQNNTELAYMSGALQARLAKSFIDGVRTARDTHGSAVLKSLFDARSIIARTALDLKLRAKSVMSLACRFFSPVYLCVNKKEGQTVEFFVSNESKNEFSGTLYYSVRDNKNTVVYENSLTVSTDRFSSFKVHEDDLFEHIYGYERQRYLEYSLIVDGNKIFSSTELFVPHKFFEFLPPDMITMVTGAGCDFSLNYSAKSFVKDAVFSFKNTDAIFEDNSVDITTPSHASVRFKTKEPSSPEVLMQELVITGAFEVGNSK